MSFYSKWVELMNSDLSIETISTEDRDDLNALVAKHIFSLEVEKHTDYNYCDDENAISRVIPKMRELFPKDEFSFRSTFLDFEDQVRWLVYFGINHGIHDQNFGVAVCKSALVRILYEGSR